MNFEKKKEVMFALSMISICIILSLLIYISYKLFPNFYPQIIIRTMPQRFFLIHSIIGYSIIISLTYRLLENFLKFKN